MSFKFRFVRSWDGWEVRSPDNIQCIMKPSGGRETKEISVGLLEIIELYELAESKEVGDVYFGPQTYLQIERTDEGVVLHVNDDLTIKTTYEELCSETKNLLRASFRSLDSEGNISKKEQQFDAYDTVAEVYSELMTD